MQFGPWRRTVIAYHRKRAGLDCSHESETVKALRKRGVAYVCPLDAEHVDAIIDFAKRKKVEDPDLHCPAIADLANAPDILAVARAYFRAEPHLVASRLFWTRPSTDRVMDRPFHYDVGDFLSVALFVYLTDVDEDSNPHVVIEETHNHKTWRELSRRTLNATDGARRFGPKIRVLTGRKGTAFFEDAACWHKRSDEGRKPRLTLILSYAMTRTRSMTLQSSILGTNPRPLPVE